MKLRNAFTFLAHRKSIGSSKNGNRDFQNRSPFERSTCFSVTISEILKQILWKTKTYFRKLEYGFLVETTKIESTSFPYKTAISEANIKTNRMASTKYTYHKERSFARNCFIFLNILSQFKNLLWSWFDVPATQMIWCTNDPNALVRTFSTRWSFISVFISIYSSSR